MRVLVLSHHAVKNSQGVYDYNLCKYLEENGIKVQNVALFGDNSHFCTNARIAKMNFKFLPPRVAKRLGQLLSTDMISEMKKNYDIIHLQGAFWSFIPLQIIFWKKIIGLHTPLVMTTHAFNPKAQKRFWSAVKSAIGHGRPKDFLSGLKCVPYTKVDKVFCQTNIEKNFVIEEFKVDRKKVVTIPNGIDVNRFEISSYDFKKKYQLKRNYMILFVGQLIRIKGIEYLLDSIKLLKRNGFDCDLILASYNPKDDVLDKAKRYGIDSNVMIIKNPAEIDLISAYKSCDVFVLPSLQESFPTVLLEAMAAKKPVVATNVGGIPDLIKDGHNGFLVKPRDPRALANKIAELLKDEKTCRKIAENGYQTVLQNYRWEEVVQLIINQYKSLSIQT